MTRAIVRVVLGGALVCLAAGVAFAQSAKSETKKFQIIAVDGNQLVVKLPEGTKELTVPDDFQFNVDGKMLSVHDLKPGMEGTATVTTRTKQIPVTVTEVKNGTVMQALGTAIIVRTEDGTMKMFSQSDISKRGIKIWREGQPAQISDFRANDRLSATIVTTLPPRTVTEKEVQAVLAKSAAGGGTGTPAGAGAAAPPARAAAPSQAATSGAGAGAAPGSAPKKLPKTASPLPALGLAGLASLVAGLGLTARRRRATR